MIIKNISLYKYTCRGGFSQPLRYKARPLSFDKGRVEIIFYIFYLTIETVPVQVRFSMAVFMYVPPKCQSAVSV